MKYELGPRIMIYLERIFFLLSFFLIQEANKHENRIQRPWIIVYGHRPMYCTGADHDDCVTPNTVTRIGSPKM